MARVCDHHDVEAMLLRFLDFDIMGLKSRSISIIKRLKSLLRGGKNMTTIFLSM